MDGTMGRRTVGGILFTKGGSILLFREDCSRSKATACCARLGCSSKFFPDKNRKMHREAKEATAPCRSHLIRKSNGKSPQGRTACESTGRNVTTKCSKTDSRPKRETAGYDLRSHLKEGVNASRNHSFSGESSSSSPNTSSTSSTSSSRSSRSISRSLHQPISRARKDEGRNSDTVSMNRYASKNSRGVVDKRNGELLSFEQRMSDSVPADGLHSRSVFTHGSRLQGRPSPYLQDSLEDSNGYLLFDRDESEQEDHFMFNDQHRGMRMNIDDMSYEELLALGEQIGTVSTGLSDDALSKCLKRSLYIPTTSTSPENGDTTCIICQEDYVSGEEVGKMACKHYYHVACIQQWLRQKNWCPICKSCASSTKS